MTEERKTVQTVTVETRDGEKEDEIRDAEERIAKIERILADVHPGWKVVLWRRSPGWCEGHLETKTIVDDEPLDLDYIAQTWGGEVIQAKVMDDSGKYQRAVDIPFRSYEPKHWGEVLVHPNFRQRKITETDQQTTERDPLSSLDGILSIIERLKAREEPRQKENSLDLGIIELLLKHQMSAQPSNALSGIEQFLQVAHAFKELKGVLGGDEQPKHDEGDMFSKINGLLDTYAKIKATEAPKTPKIAPPTVVQRPLIGPTPQPQNVNNPSISDLLVRLDPKVAAESVLTALERMGEEQRETALRIFFEHLGVEEEDTVNDSSTETFDDSAKNVQNLNRNATDPSRSSKGSG